MMMATAAPPSSSSLLPLLESLEDDATGQTEQTDAYLTIANRLSGEEGRQFLPAVAKHFSRLSKSILVHITSSNADLSQAALQALGFCVYHSHIVSELQEPFTAEILSALCSLIVKSTDKNTCTRALWVISKQSFPADVVTKKTPSILTSLESVWSRDDIQSVVMEHEALNVVIRLLEQVPPQMGEGAVRWVKLVVPLVVHSASKVRLRAAAAMELGMSLLLDRQKEVAAIIEPMMSTKLIPELQKLFMSKNETNVLKLWPLFVKLLGKMLHRGGPFINSLLHLEELGFRSSSPTVKKIAFIAWKSLIDNFALNPDILCSSKRLRLLMQPLTSIHVRTEALLLTKVEVWWYLVVQLRHNLSPNFDQVSVPLLQSTLGCDVSSVPGTPSRSVGQNGASTPISSGFNSPANSSRLSLNSSINVSSTFPSIQLLGLEMLLHYFLGPDAVGAAAKRKLVLSLEPLTHPLVSGVSSFTKHAAVLINNIGDGFINIGKEAPDSLLSLIWTNLIHFVNLTIESGGSKKERQGCEVLTLMLQTLQSVATSESLPADKVLLLLEATVTGIPPRVLGSASYQVGKMDVLNGTPALFLIQLLFNSSWMSTFIHDVRFFDCLQTLVGCGLSGPASPLAFAEAVLAAIRGSAVSVQSKEQLWRMWSVVVAPLTDTITQTNEVNQGDALEHNFSAVHAALMFPATHLLSDGSSPLQPASQRSMLSSWSKLYKVFARCSALVVTAEENVCCEELCAKMAAVLDRDALKVPSTLNAVGSFLQLMVECVDFSPYTPQFQQKLKSPHTPVNWTRKRNKALGNLSTFQSLLVQSLDVFLEEPDVVETTGVALVSVVSTLFSNLVLANAVRETLAALVRPLALFYEQAAKETTAFTAPLINKLEKLLSDVFACLQSRSTLAFDDDLLLLLSPLLCVVFLHRNKQLRTTAAHFWNASFANAVSLRYPDDLRPILSQVKQKVPIILPGFEVVCVSEELSGQYSSESSQMETKLSGVSVSSVGKRESLLNKSTEVKEKTSAKPVSMKLDFSSPKPPRRDVLEEEASIDFVFIPPETKERVLTEHQKEVKRTKRVDIPVMYNNLDASLDTTVFSQFTQSQDDSLDKPLVAQTDSAHKEAPVEVPHEEMETEDDTEVSTKDTQEYVSPTHATGNHQQGDVTTESADVSMEDEVKTDDKTTDAKDGSSPNVSGSSDLVSGTPQKPNSRRQTFITLEKYAEGKSSSPSSSSKFTGPLVKTSNSQKDNDAATASSDPKTTSQHPVTNITESPRRPKDAAMKTEPVRLTERLPSDTTEDEDVIPDTQTQPEEKETTTASSRDEELDDSQTSPGDVRRSGRSKVRPGADHDDKHPANKRRRSKAESDSQKTSPPSQSRPNTRSKAEEDSGRDRLRSRSHRDSSQNSQTRSHKKIRLYSSSQDFMDNPEPRRRSSSQTDLQSDSQSDESQSQGRRRRRSKAAVEADEEGGAKKKVTNDKKPTNEMEEEKTEHENEMKVVDPSSQELVELVEQNKDNEVTNESQVVCSSPQTRNESQQQEEKQDSPTTESRDESKSESKDQSKTTDTIETKSDKPKLRESERHDDLSQDESQVVTPSPSDAQTLRRSRRSKVSSEAESEDKSESQDSQRLTRSNSQTGGRTRRSKAHEDPTSTPESSQSLDHVGSSESQGRGRYSRRRSSQVGLESSESESSQVKENQAAPKKRGRKPRASLPSPVIPEPKDGNTDDTMKEADEPEDEETQKSEVKPEETQSSEAQHEAGSEKTPETPEIKDVTVSESRQETDDEEQSNETMMEVEASGETDDVKTTETLQEEKRDEDTLEPVNDTAAPPGDTAEELQVSESSDDKQTDETETSNDELDQVDPDNTSSQQEAEAPPGGVSEEADDVNTQITEGQDEEPAADPEPGPSSVCDTGPGPEDVVVNLDAALIELCDASSSIDGKVVSDESPVKSKDLDAVVGPDVGQSPRTRGTWSPSASPSTSILKKGQKRPLHEDTPSPLVKSRRVSFADPIQQQETADDIDRRSPALRTSSPRRTKTSGIPQSKYITTPTKGLMMLSPRNMRSPGFKSSKKCLISEMSQGPRPVPRDCIYPPLVGCSAPVEAVLPQISSTMWSRGFGQLVRSRNIKTVGDLSALTPAEVKTLPVRSPKVSNVKKALKVYEQQRKGRGGDELKSFDETEMMTSEADETNAAHNHDDKMAADDDDKMAAETLATALVDEPLADVTPQQEVDVSVTRTSVAAATVEAGRPEEEAEPRGSTLLSEAESLTCRMTSEELRRCSPQQLLHIHETLGDAMRRVVEEMKTRLSGTDGDGGR